MFKVVILKASLRALTDTNMNTTASIIKYDRQIILRALLEILPKLLGSYNTRQNTYK